MAIDVVPNPLFSTRRDHQTICLVANLSKKVVGAQVIPFLCHATSTFESEERSVHMGYLNGYSW